MSSDAASRPAQLPRGPHGLSREAVESDQRDRLLRAMAEAVAEHGYARTSVADVIRRAGVSRATFYVLFQDREDCFLAASRAAVERVTLAMQQALFGEPATATADPLAPLERLLRAYLHTLAKHPGLARIFLVDVFAIGPDAVEQRLRSMELFTALAMAQLPAAPDAEGRRQQQEAVRFLVHAISSQVTLLVSLGRADELPSLQDELIAVGRRLLGASLR